MAEYVVADGRSVEIGRLIPDGRYNAYACDRGHHNLALDLDEGVTPMFLTCRRIDGCGDPTCWCGLKPGEECGARSVSAVYPEQAVPPHLFPVRIIWRRPTAAERGDPSAGDHYAQGGLALEWVRPDQKGPEHA